ncbi:MAG: 5'/3'-nucleotidase SurE [Armatimonadota bacterium]
MKRLLVTNDDGIGSPGLLALAEVLTDLGEVIIVAPDRERSAASHAVTLHKPLRVEPAAVPISGVRAYITNGTPADCVVLGALAVIAGKPDLVASGINGGPNLGDDVTYSGTVAGAREGAIVGAPAFAVSVAGDEVTDYSFAARFSRRLAERVLATGLPADVFLNVNIPDLPPEQIEGAELTRLGRRRWDERLVKRQDPRGRDYYWLVGEPNHDGSASGSDVAAVLAGSISITPAHMDLTSHSSIAELAELTTDLL